MRTFFDENEANDSKETRASKLEEFPKTFVPYAEALVDDFRTACDFCNALNQGVQTLSNTELSAADKAVWANASAYLKARPF